MAKEQQTTPAETVDSVDAAQAQVKEIEVRRQKLAALRERGIDPFGAAFAASHTTKQALEQFQDDQEEQTVQIAGRIMSKRGQGKVCFWMCMTNLASCKFTPKLTSWARNSSRC